MPDRMITVSSSMPIAFAKRLDAMAHADQMTRSALIRVLLEEAITARIAKEDRMASRKGGTHA